VFLLPSSLACRDIKAENLLLDECGVAHIADFGCSYAFDTATGTAVGAAVAANGTSSSSAVCEVTTGMLHGLQPFQGPSMKTVAGMLLYMSPKIGNVAASPVYASHVDCYAVVVLLMSLLLGGWSGLCDAAEPVPAGVSQQQYSIKAFLHRFADGLSSYSVELRDFVEHGISSTCMVDSLLLRPWVMGKQLQM
jgi:serine/threonine protein kinase